jgi:hypothetical protein
MTKRTDIVASAELKRRIPPARAMPFMASRARSPGYVSAKTVGSFVPGLTRKAFEKYGFSTASLITDWEKIAGSKFAAFTAPQRLKWPQLPGSRDAASDDASSRPGATLLIKVDPAHALQTEDASRQIIDRINAYFGYRAVAEIRLIQAPSTQASTAEQRPQRGARAVVRPVPADLDAIPDKGLSAALARMHAGISSRTR